MPFLVIVIAILLLYFFIRDRINNRRIYAVSDSIPGPKAWPILGSSLEFATDSVGIFKKLSEFSDTYGRYYKLWNAGKFFIVIKDVQDVETILADNTNITKSDFYKFIIPWIGYGLLTSTGKKWRKHRKIITPTFFFKILEDFQEVFNRNGKLMCESLENEVGKGTFNMFDYVNRTALDNICETAMGVEVHAQKNKESKYLKAVKTICGTAALRFFMVWLMPDILFKFSPYGGKQREAIDFIHDATVRLIKEKREAIRLKEEAGETAKKADDEGIRKKTAFLDLLMEYAGSQLTDEEIKDEVNTFMFEGHDTVSSATTFALYELAMNADVQERLYEEQMELLGNSDAPLELKHFTEMRYLDKVVKETLRLYPSVPLIGREIDEDLQLVNGPLIPKGSNVIISFYSLHRDPKTWTNPNKFDPENFNADLDVRHPFAYVPFSAGSRNCIGQKFALMEMKTIISFIVRNFKLLPSDNPDDKLMLTNELVLISKNGQKVRLDRR